MTNLKKYSLNFQKSIARWDEAIPLGNGKMGCLVYGDGPLRFAVDRIDLWDERENDIIYQPEYNYPYLVEIMKNITPETWDKKRDAFQRGFGRTAYPSKISAGRIELDFGGKCENIHSFLDLKTATATFEIEDQVKVEKFMSATRFVGVMRIYGRYSLSIHISDYISGGDGSVKQDSPGEGLVNYDYIMNYPKTSIVSEGEYTYFHQKTCTDYNYGMILLTKHYQDYDEIYYDVITSEDDEDVIGFGKTRLAECACVGYDQLLKEHARWWSKYWKKSSIEIPDQDLEQAYYMSWYLFASTSRKGYAPMALQGVWTADNDALPPWRGDYHHDTNTQLSYQSYCKANRLEEGSTFVDYLWDTREQFQKFAKDFYKVDGYMIPGTSTLKGGSVGGWPQYSLTPTMTIWSAQSFDEYFLYTGDMEFLKERAYPFFKEVGKAILALLVEEDGVLRLPLSSSPEIHEDDIGSYLTPNSNFDLSLLLYLFMTLKRYAELLGEDSSLYTDALSKLEPIAVNEDNIIMLDRTQLLPFSHRHFSHMMCVYPLHVLNYDTKEHQDIIEATLLHIEQLGVGWWVGFSFGMCALMYAMAHNGGAAREKIKTFVRGFIAPNGFHLNGDYKKLGICQWHYRPFTLESLYAYCDAIQEMLLQEHHGYVELFPAIPVEWEKKVSFKDFRSYGGVLVSASYTDGTVEASFVVEKDTDIMVKNTFADYKVSIKNDIGTTEVSVERGECFALKLSKGKTVVTAK